MMHYEDVPTTIVCHFDELEQTENDDMMDDLCSSVRSSYTDNHRDLSRSSHAASNPKGDLVTSKDLRAMKDMIASMRENPELLNISPVMQRACLTMSSFPDRQQRRRVTTDGIAPSLIVPDDNVKNEDLCAMKDMIASMRKNPMLLYQSPIMQRACYVSTANSANNTAPTSAATTNDTSPRLISPHETTAAGVTTHVRRRPLGTKFDPSTFPSLPLPSVPRGESIDKKKAPAATRPSPPAVVAVAPPKMDVVNSVLSHVRPKSI